MQGTGEDEGLGEPSEAEYAPGGGSLGQDEALPHAAALDAGGLNLGAAPKLGAGLTMEGEHLFGSSPIFAGLERDEIREIVGAAKKHTVQAGQLLFEQGAHASAVYIVQTGEVQVRATSPMGEDIVLAVLGAGTIVGELALIDGGPRSATVEAIADCDTYRLSRSAFDALRRSQRPAAYKVILNLAETVDARRRGAEARIDEVFEDPAAHIEQFESQVHDMLARLHKA